MSPSSPTGHSAATPRPRRPWLLAGLALVAGLTLNEVTLGVLISVNEQIDGAGPLKLIRAAQAGLLLLGLGCWLLRLPRGRGLRRAGALALAPLAALGLYGVAVWDEWLPRSVRTLPEQQDWLTSDRAPIFGRYRLKWLEEQLGRSTGRAQADTLLKYATELMRHGLELDAVRAVEDWLEMFESSEQFAELEHDPEARVVRADLYERVGVARLRQGEVLHCLEGHHCDSCLFPLVGASVWADDKPARLAIEAFDKSLSLDPGDLGVRWMLNIAHQAAGTFPGGVEARWQIPPEKLLSEQPFHEFPDVAVELGIDATGLLGGAVMDDFDDDGWLDLIVSDYDPDGDTQHFRNDGNGQFTPVSERFGLGDQKGVFNLLQADYDNDGRLDLFCLRGAWLRAFGRQRNSLMRQIESGEFRDVTVEVGLGETAYPSIAAGFGDANGDGHLDLFVANGQLTRYRAAPSKLHLGDGSGGFVDATNRGGVDNRRNATSMSWGDIDNDGDLDLYVSNLNTPNRMYRNDGDAVFEDVAEELGVGRVAPLDRTFGCWFFDYDNDGWEDLFVGDYGARTIAEAVSDRLGESPTVETSRLFHNTGGSFDDVSAFMGLDRVLMPMGANYGDLNGDGDLDLYLGTGAPPFGYLVPNVMLLNAGASGFKDVTTDARVGQLQKGHGIALGDYDNDGDVDVLAQVGGWYPADRFPNALFQNPGHGQPWIGVRLVGTSSNRSAIGARVRIGLELPGGGARDLWRTVGSGGSFGANSLRLEVGLGGANAVRDIEVFWPSSRKSEFFEPPAIGRFEAFVEGSGSSEPLL